MITTDWMSEKVKMAQVFLADWMRSVSRVGSKTKRQTRVMVMVGQLVVEHLSWKCWVMHCCWDGSWMTQWHFCQVKHQILDVQNDSKIFVFRVLFVFFENCHHFHFVSVYNDQLQLMCLQMKVTCARHYYLPPWQEVGEKYTYLYGGLGQVVKAWAWCFKILSRTD